MRKLLSLVVSFSFITSVAGAGPIADSARKAAIQTATERERVPEAKNNLLWPGLALVAAGGTMAVIGMTQTTGAEVNASCRDYWCDDVNVGVNEKKNTALALTGAGVAGVGAFLIWKGENDKNKSRVNRVELAPTHIRWIVRF